MPVKEDESCLFTWTATTLLIFSTGVRSQEKGDEVSGWRRQGELPTTGRLHYLLLGPLCLPHLEAQRLHLLSLALDLLLLVPELATQTLLR